MDKQDQIIELLTEIRDLQREERDWRRKAVEESVHLQRVGVQRQLLGLMIVVPLILGAVAYLAWTYLKATGRL